MMRSKSLEELRRECLRRGEIRAAEYWYRVSLLFLRDILVALRTPQSVLARLSMSAEYHSICAFALRISGLTLVRYSLASMIRSAFWRCRVECV